MAQKHTDFHVMPSRECEDVCDGMTSEQSVSKPIEIYMFIDPLCPE